MIFKKKYKKSEWMEGYEILGRGTSKEKPHTIKRCSREFGRGVIDYIEYKDNSLNN